MAEHEIEWQAPRGFRLRSFVFRDWPYLLMFGLALAGVAQTSIGQPAMTPYWITLAPIYGIICVALRWREIKGREAHWRLVRMQVLHWIAVMLAMYLVLMASVERIMNSPASALTVLTVLALGTFTAGIHAEAWRITLVGLVLGLAVPAIAWLETSTVLLLIVVVLLTAVAVMIFVRAPPPVGRGAGHTSI